MRRKHLPCHVLALWLAAVVAAYADPTDDFIRAQMARQNIPGLSLAVVKAGKVVKATGYGLANRKTMAPATPDTVYKIGSVSKQFLATGIMLLAQEGRLGLGDPVSKYVQDTPAAWNGITIRHLLNHTAGLVREAPGFDAFTVQADHEVVRTAYGVPLRFPPGDKWEYSNLGYYALAEIISRVSGQPWSDFIAARVFRPSGMLSTRTTTTTESVPNRAAGYSDNDKLIDAEDWPAVRPSGAFLSTVLDLARWDTMLYTDAVLTEATRRQMWTPAALNDGTSYPYGFGWHLNRPGQRRQVYHGGGIPGFVGQFRRYVADRVTVIILMNSDDVDAEAIGFGVAELHLEERR